MGMEEGEKKVGTDSSQGGHCPSDSVPVGAVRQPLIYSSRRLALLFSGKPHLSPQRIARRVRLGMGILGVPALFLSLLALCGVTGGLAFLWLTTLPPLPNCKKLSSLASDAERLYCAEQATHSGEAASILAALDLVKKWSSDHPLYGRTQPLVNEWSKVVLDNALAKASQSDFMAAIALVRKIPVRSELYKEAQAKAQSWQKDLTQGQDQQAALEAALKAQDWKAADAQLQVLSTLDTPYLQHHLNTLRQKFVTERTAYQQLQQARQIESNSPDNLEAVGQAIALLDQISAETYIRSEAEQELNRLIPIFVELAAARLAQSDGSAGVAAAQYLPSSIVLPGVARDLLWVSRAQPLAVKKFPDQPVLEQLWWLWSVLPQVRQINANSLLRPQAQALTPQLEQQIRSLTNLYAAFNLAQWKQIPTLKIAIQMAQAIPPGSSQRIYAQTLIAQWRKELQQIEDLPQLLAAHQTAAAGTVPQLQAAIAQASQIPLGRALRPNAQALIFDWQQEIQTIEDKPILDKAEGLAKQNNLQEAIQVAAQIRSDRALHQQAQTAIQTWTSQIQIAEDRPILDEAYALASQGRLSRAIDTAYQIAPDRALYGEAQSVIAQWSAERDAILRARQSKPESDRPTEADTDNFPQDPSASDPYPPPPGVPPVELPPP
jgi:hypothetical protein